MLLATETSVALRNDGKKTETMYLLRQQIDCQPHRLF